MSFPIPHVHKQVTARIKAATPWQYVTANMEPKPVNGSVYPYVRFVDFQTVRNPRSARNGKYCHVWVSLYSDETSPGTIYAASESITTALAQPLSLSHPFQCVSGVLLDSKVRVKDGVSGIDLEFRYQVEES